MQTLRILDRTGDTALAFEKADPEALAKATRVFNEFREKNYLAYRKEAEGRGEQVREFDPNAEEIVMHEPLVGG